MEAWGRPHVRIRQSGSLSASSTYLSSAVPSSTSLALVRPRLRYCEVLSEDGHGGALSQISNTIAAKRDAEND